MKSELLHVITCVFNPLRWKSRIIHARNSIKEWRDDGAKVYVVECVSGEREYELDDIEGIVHIPVRSYGLAWNKENLLNIGISRLPHNAKYIMIADADVHFRKRSWASETVHALQLHPVIQPWHTCIDLGPNDETIQVHRSFASLHHEGKPVVSNGSKFWRFDGGPYEYSHTGYCWAFTRRFLEEIGGLIEICGMGSADHHMAYGLIGEIERSIPLNTNKNYFNHLKLWEERAERSSNHNLGFVSQTIEHHFHGRKQDRGYISRWKMFIDHDFDPLSDLKKNTYGVIEFSGNKPELTRIWDNYMRSRKEDSGSL
jgi:hypothetical protein